MMNHRRHWYWTVGAGSFVFALAWAAATLVGAGMQQARDAVQASKLSACLKEIDANCAIAMLPFCMPAYENSGACERALDYCAHLTDADRRYACQHKEFPNKDLRNFTTHWHYESPR